MEYMAGKKEPAGSEKLEPFSPFLPPVNTVGELVARLQMSLDRMKDYSVVIEDANQKCKGGIHVGLGFIGPHYGKCVILAAEN